MEWKPNPTAELIIDLAGRATDGNPGLRDKWRPELLRFLSENFPSETVTDEAIKAALQAGDDLTAGKPALKTSAQRKKFRELFPTE